MSAERATPGPSRSTSETVERVLVWPHRSLGSAGARVLLTAVGAVFAVVAMWALRDGAWPMAVYALSAFGGFAFALCRNYRDARLCQTIELTADAILVHQAGPAARTLDTVEFSPHWVRIDVARGQDDEPRLLLRQSGRCVAIGDFLSPGERRELAVMLEARIAARYRAM